MLLEYVGLWMLNRRSLAEPLGPPSTIVLAAPAPMIVRLSVISKSPVAAASSPAPVSVSIYTPEGSVMTSTPGSAFASCTAARSVQVPVAVWHRPSPMLSSTRSDVSFTVNVAAQTGCSDQSRLSINPTEASERRAICRIWRPLTVNTSQNSKSSAKKQRAPRNHFE